MGFFTRFLPKNRGQVVSTYKMISDNGGGFYQWDGKLYKSDIVRACIRPKSRAIGKAVAKHIRRDPVKGLQVNPDAYMRFLLEEPNQYMTGQVFQEKLINQLELNGNAFAWIQRDENGFPLALYPVNCSGVQLIKDISGNIYLKFFINNSTPFTAAYSDIIHLRKDYFNDEFFGESPGASLTQLMDVVCCSDQSIVSAIKNSSVIKWLLKFNTTVRREDLEKQAKQFADGFLSTSSTTGGVAAVDAKADATQINPTDYVPNAAQTDRTIKRLYSFFNTNESIVMCNYSENQWISYYETAVEPDIAQLSGEFTRKLFSRRERGFGNAIIFESMNLQFASMQTKLALSAMVDRGAMTPNEWRETFNLAPVPGGDEPIRRLDTAVVDSTDDDSDTGNGDSDGKDGDGNEENGNQGNNCSK
jgi:HK97 family phage portal protein